MKRIAIVACENSNTVCAGCACLNAFYDRRKSFERYAGEELRLMAFMRCSHCVKDGDPMQDAGFVEKLERFVSESSQLRMGVFDSGSVLVEQVFSLSLIHI